MVAQGMKEMRDFFRLKDVMAHVKLGEISEINAEPSKKINVCANVSNEFFASEIKRPNLHYGWT